jgi:hypothetical protein
MFPLVMKMLNQAGRILESQAIMVDHSDWGAAWRQREFDTISSPEFAKRRK